MSTKGKRLIWVGPADGANHKPLNIEGVALEADILPGMIVEYDPAGTGLKKSATLATDFGLLMKVADKDQQRSKSVDDPWVINENMVAVQPRSGEFVNVLAAAAVYVVGQPMTHVAGGLASGATTDGTNQIVGFSDEALTLAANGLLRIRIA